MKKIKKSYDYPPKDNIKLKELIKSVFEQKTFYESEDDDDDDDDEDDEKKKKPTKKTNTKRRHKKRESSDESPKNNSSDHEKEKPKKHQRHREKERDLSPVNPPEPPKPKSSLVDILDFDSPVKESAPAPGAAAQADSGWGDFSAPTSAPKIPTQPSPPAQVTNLPPTQPPVSSNPLSGINLNPSPITKSNPYQAAPVKIFLF